VDHTAFTSDLTKSYRELQKWGIDENHAKYFLPPYEWYNDTIAEWTREMGLQLINYSPGTLSNADYTTPDMRNYRSSDTIFESIKNYEETHAEGLNGFILLLHIGTGPDRTDKFYKRLPELTAWLRSKKYAMVRVDQLLKD
jgi:peptidoglycan/xylan/chitin deacetylase (PgdA/CDA1 family)